MNEKQPNWLKKPKHRKEVVMSDKGWIVKDTGELLVSVPNMKAKLAAYLGTSEEMTPSYPEVKIIAEPVVTEPEVVTDVPVETADDLINDLIPSEEAEPVVEAEVKEEAPKKKRGRKPKAKPEEAETEQ
jgi:hypothetical protein